MLKTLPFLVAMLIVSQFLSAQKVVENPKHGFTTVGNLQITKVELTDSFTILSFHFESSPGTGIWIPGGSFIQPANFPDKLFVIKAKDIPLDGLFKINETGKADYLLYFPAVDMQTDKLDFGEANDGGNWFIYDIELIKIPYAGVLPETLIGNWFATDGSKELKIALYDSLSVFNSQVWKYGKVVQSGKNLEVELINSKGKQKILISPVDSVTCKFGTSKKTMIELCDYPKEISGYKIPNDLPFTMPILKEGQATYNGYIRNFTTRAGQKTGKVSVDNVITGNQDTYTVKIADDGTFSISFPLVYPHEAFVEMPYFYGTIFMEPGKETFHLMDWNGNKNLYMGELAHINSDLIELKLISYFNYSEMQEKIVDMNPEQYKTFCFDIHDRELAALNNYVNTHSISAKAKQIKEYSIRYNAPSTAMGYGWSFESAYRKKNNIPREKREIDIQITKPDSSFYSFITNSFVNDTLAIISTDYDRFINRVKYLEFIRTRYSVDTKPSNIAVLVKNAGKILTPEEDEFVRNSVQMADSITSKNWGTFNEKFGEKFNSFLGKYRDSINSNLNDESFILWYDVENVLSTKGITLTPNEKEMLEAAKAIQTREQLLTQNEFNKKNKDTQQIFYNKYQYLFDQKRERDRKENSDQKMKELFGIEKGLAADIMFAQDVSRSIIEEVSPMEINDLKIRLTPITTSFITDYIVKANEITKQKIEANKLKTGYNVNTTPSVEADQLFDSMLAKFKGKVVFVDFWATWCSPCRSAIEWIKPLKDELEGKNIVFVYITNKTSPEGTWKNTIPDIKGEHFRVTADEWNILTGKFNISGIPHYVLVDKNGVVAKNDGMPEFDSVAMKKMFEEFMAK